MNNHAYVTVYHEGDWFISDPANYITTGVIKVDSFRDVFDYYRKMNYRTRYLVDSEGISVVEDFL